MIAGAKLNTDYKDLIDLLVCNSERSESMVDLCELCPGKQFLIELLDTETDDLPDYFYAVG